MGSSLFHRVLSMEVWSKNKENIIDCDPLKFDLTRPWTMKKPRFLRVVIDALDKMTEMIEASIKKIGMACRFITKKNETRKGRNISENDQRLSQKTILIPKAAGCGQLYIY